MFGSHYGGRHTLPNPPPPPPPEFPYDRVDRDYVRTRAMPEIPHWEDISVVEVVIPELPVVEAYTFTNTQPPEIFYPW